MQKRGSNEHAGENRLARLALRCCPMRRRSLRPSGLSDTSGCVIAASAAGGNPDVLARLLTNRLSEVLGSPFIVEDVPGAGGVIAAKQVMAAKPDGYTLMINDSGGMAINVAMNLGDDPVEDFTPITALATLPTVLVVKPALPAKTLAEFVALAKSMPGKMASVRPAPGRSISSRWLSSRSAPGSTCFMSPIAAGRRW